MHHSFYRTISYNCLIINHTHILSAAPFIFLPIITPVNNVTTSYTWDGIYPVSKTVGNQTSTFSYIPYVGMSSMTDARGVTTYYAYDTYGRLIEVYRQHNTHGKEILNHYIYHTKTE